MLRKLPFLPAVAPGANRLAATLAVAFVALVALVAATATTASAQPATTAAAEPAAAEPAAASSPDPFSALWHDGQAELDGYRWTGSRYGESRRGTCVMIFVTEPFSSSHLVKIDDAANATDDYVDVLKLNLVRDFQTGIYDYNTMISVFARSDDFTPLKVSFSSAEWCGHVYEELRRSGDRIERQTLSYFEGETSSESLQWKRGAVVEDNLFIALRGLRGVFLEAGEHRTVPFLTGSFNGRLAHRHPAWTRATITRQASTERIEVGAGAFETMLYVVEVEGGRSGRFWIETVEPHRIVRWEWSAGGTTQEAGELTGTRRLRYWQLHGNGDERWLRELGMPVPPSE